MRHKETNDEVQLSEDFLYGVRMIRTLYGKANAGSFREINRQCCQRDEDEFDHIWEQTIKAYQCKGWEEIK
jgi:hypothetical protein